MLGIPSRRVVDQFADQSAPRKGIREVSDTCKTCHVSHAWPCSYCTQHLCLSWLQVNKRRLISLACLSIAGTPLAAAFPVPAALAAADLLRLGGGQSEVWTSWEHLLRLDTSDNMTQWTGRANEHVPLLRALPCRLWRSSRTTTTCLATQRVRSSTSA